MQEQDADGAHRSRCAVHDLEVYIVADLESSDAHGLAALPDDWVGKTEEEPTEAGIPCEIGISRYRELARGQILRDSHGMLKLLVSAEERRLIGVHALGAGATEVIHIGQTVMAFGGTIDYLVEAVFNYPTLAEGTKSPRSMPRTRLQLSLAWVAVFRSDAGRQQ